MALLCSRSGSCRGRDLEEATAVSADGTTVVGFGIDPQGVREAFVAVVPEPGMLALVGVFGAACLRRRHRTF